MNSTLTATYFPFTFISPSLVQSLTPLFRRLVVYNPAYSTFQETLRPWIEMGFVDLRIPFEKCIDKTALDRSLRGLKEYAIFHEHSDMELIKTLGNSIAPATPMVPNIVSEIKAAAQGGVKDFPNGEFLCQVFLHLAHEYDKDLWDLSRQLIRVNEQYQALRGYFCQDQTEDGFEAMPMEPAPVEQKDRGDAAIEKRMAVWNNLFQKDPVDDSTILLTDSSQAATYVLDKVEYRDRTCRLSGQTPGSGGTAVSISLYLIADQSPADILNRVCGVTVCDETKNPAKGRNTFVGIVEQGR